MTTLLITTEIIKRNKNIRDQIDTYQNRQILEDIAHEENAIDRRSAASFVNLDSLLSQTSSAVSGSTGARPARGIPMLRMAFKRS